VKKFVLLLFLLLFTFPRNALSDIYYSFGGVYLIPISKFSDKNKESFGAKFEIMNKNYCRLWYGLRFDYFSLQKEKNEIDYYKKEFLISPTIKYSPFVKNCYDWKLLPYAEVQFNISGISGTDERSQLGLGGGAGLGLAYNFKLFKKCWMIDLDAVYSSPNFIYRADKRGNLKSLNCGLSLSVSL